MNVGIGLALLCAAVTQLGFLCKHRGAAHAPRVELQQPLRSAKALFRSRWFLIGMGIAAGAWSCTSPRSRSPRCASSRSRSRPAS